MDIITEIINNGLLVMILLMNTLGVIRMSIFAVGGVITLCILYVAYTITETVKEENNKSKNR